MGKKCFGASEKVDKFFLYSSLHYFKNLRHRHHQPPLVDRWWRVEGYEISEVTTEGKDWPRPFLLIMCVTIKALGIAFAYGEGFHQRWLRRKVLRNKLFSFI